MTEKEITSANELIEQKKKILLKRKIQKKQGGVFYVIVGCEHQARQKMCLL